MDIDIGEELLKEEQKNSPYFLDELGNLCRWKQSKDGYISIRLANFEAHITEELSEDNGIDVTYNYCIEGTCLKQPLPKINVPANSFHSMNWLPQWGSQVIVEPGLTNKDFLRHSIQVMSNGVRKNTCYTHTGWRKINGDWCYLTASGAIGSNNVTVKLSRELNSYHLPLQPENEAEAIRASLSFLDLGPRIITLPLFCYTYLAPLTTLLRPMPNFAVYLHGFTGVFKTTLACLCLSHFGSFDSVNNLSNFEDTANAVEKRSFELKDILHCVDDYHPSYRRVDAQIKESLAQRTIRAYSNRSARHRLKSDTTERGAYIPRGLLLMTGEEIPSLQSTNARICVIDINDGDIDTDKLTEIQTKAHLLPAAMTSYIIWIRDRINDIQGKFAQDFTKLRDKAYKEGHHLKLPEQTAFLQFSLDMILNWLTDKSIFNEEEAKEMSLDGWDTFLHIAEKQSKRIEQEDPVRRFKDILQTLLKQNKVNLQNKDLGGDIIGGTESDLIGYYDDVFFYLLPTAVWHIVQRFCIKEGSHFPFSRQTFYRILKSRNIIETDPDHSTKTEWINGKSQKVLKVVRERIGLENI